MRSYSSREVIKIIEADGWYLVNTKGSHHQYKHPKKKGQGDCKTPRQRYTSKDAEKN